MLANIYLQVAHNPLPWLLPLDDGSCLAWSARRNCLRSDLASLSNLRLMVTHALAAGAQFPQGCGHRDSYDASRNRSSGESGGPTLVGRGPDRIDCGDRSGSRRGKVLAVFFLLVPNLPAALAAIAIDVLLRHYAFGSQPSSEPRPV